MGMFDTLICKVPLPKDAPSFIEPGHRFQTKDLDRTLSTYEITEEGLLVQLTGFCDDPLSEPKVYTDYHGDLRFYTSNIRGLKNGDLYTENGEKAESVDYRARFTNGKLQDILEVGKTCLSALPIASFDVVGSRQTGEESEQP